MKTSFFAKGLLIALAAVSAMLMLTQGGTTSAVQAAAIGEYKLVRVSGTPEHVEQTLNSYAKQGWELVSVAVTGSPETSQTINLYLRK